MAVVSIFHKFLPRVVDIFAEKIPSFERIRTGRVTIILPIPIRCPIPDIFLFSSEVTIAKYNSKVDLRR